MKKRTLSLILAALLMSQLAACGSSGQVGGDTTAELAGGDGTTAPADEVSGVPEDTDFNGEKIGIWYTTKSTSLVETFVDLNPTEQTGEILDDATFALNLAVEEKLNVDLEFFNAQVQSALTGDAIRKLLLADDTTYDVFHGVQWNAKNLILEGLYLDIKDAPYISFDKPWWDLAYMDAMSINNNRLFSPVGDYAVDRTRCLNCIYYNKNMFEDFFGDGDGLYTEVLGKEWTYDRMREISSTVYADLNSNGSADRDDTMGMFVNSNNNVDGFFFGTTVKLTKRNSKGFPEVVFNSERAVDTTEGLYRLMFETEGILCTGTKSEDDLKNLGKFTEGSVMFFPGYFYTAEAMREMTDDYGIIPYPLLNDEQSEYQSLIHDIMRIMYVPYNCQKYDEVCAVLEEMAFIGYKDVLPQYYDVLLKNKYARDDVSAEMIEIIRGSIYPDVGYTMNPGNLAKIPRLLMQEKSSDFASMYASRIEGINAKLDEYRELYEAINN